MIRFLRGDPNNLEGRAFLFSRLDNPELITKKKYPEVFGIYFSTNPDDFCKNTDIPGGMVDEMKTRLEKFKEISKEKKNIPVLSVFIYEFTLNSYSEVHSREGDLVEAKPCVETRDCMDIARAAQKIYEIAYRDQYLRGLEAMVPEPQNVLETEKFDSYLQVEKDELDGYLLRNFVDPLIDSKRRNNSAQYQVLKSELITFCEGSLFMRDVLEIIKLVEFPKKHIDAELIHAYLNRIQAVNAENFEVAAGITQAIQKHRG